MISKRYKKHIFAKNSIINTFLYFNFLHYILYKNIKMIVVKIIDKLPFYD